MPKDKKYITGRQLMESKQMGPIHKHVKSFTATMLEVSSMTDGDHFYFVVGLKLWTKYERGQHKLNSLSSALTPRLIDT